ncbi:polyadenylate-binding protein-interacting protein 8-like [Panicum virgatum]|uniref:polyadenylate-binding protein-interacting protein 8-like n=1 Tax=Panicum virgatum TaxID=38727 RepID=UPI0019D608C0|nr:polyadenylate-binding protein-interacting protein 8-like [Panicum virgatum]
MAQGSAAVIVKKALSVDAPEFVTPANKGPAAADAGGNDATPPGNVRTGRRGAYRPRKSLSRSQEAVKRTVFVKYIDHTITEQILAALFWSYGTVVHCRICGDHSNGLRFGFVEFQREEEAYSALLLNGIIVGMNPLSVSPSRTAICPINPRFLPQSEAEWEMCSRTIYCTNISKIVQSSDLKAFCEAYFGKVCRLKLLDNDRPSTNLAFIEFAEVDAAIAALGCDGIFAGGHRIRICPSKTPIRGYCYGRSPVVAGALVDTNQVAPPELLPVNGGSTMVS